MFCGHKLQQIAAIALSLVFFGFSQAAFALGLSDISVYSSLGEPLRASVDVLGAQDLSGDPCLSLGKDSDLKPVNLNLGPINGSTARIAITSNQIVNEPIVNLSIIAGCSSSIQRSYVLLLDPPFSSANQTNKQLNNTIPPLKKPAAQTQKRAVSPSTSSASANSQKKRTSKKQSASGKKSSTKKRSQATNTSRPSKPSKSKSAASTKRTPKAADVNNDAGSQPRLSISGGGPSLGFNDTGLRLEKTLDLSPGAYRAPMLNPEDLVIEDELTVVNNRLAHLQQQIEVLQAQNLKLSSDNKLKTEQLSNQKPQKTTFNILLFIIALLLLILAYILFSWLRRRQLEKQSDNTKSIWATANKPTESAAYAAPVTVVASDTDDDDSDDEADVEDEAEDNALDVDEAEADDTLPPAPAAGIFKPEEDEQLVVEDEQAFSVLDHADVFLFHGRANLAIKLLQEFLIEHPKQSVTIWLFLLDLLAKENLKDQYEETATDCKLYYNVKVPAFSEAETASMDSLEDFPRLAKGLDEVWGTPKALVYLDDLIYNNRPEPRAGLPKALIEELVLLKAIAQENTGPADMPQLDESKLAEIKEKEALLETRKQEKLKEIAEAEKAEKEKNEAEKNETSFEFTLVDK